nr:choice-of-anchor D domain-containing protein [Halochromatium roseum]
MINDTDHRIRGAQDGGTATLSMDNNVTLVNRGLIQADSGDTVALSGGQLDNTATAGGTVQATGGGTLALNAIGVDNAGGLIQALDGSRLEIRENTSISGGLLSTAGTGVIEVTSSSYSNSARLTDVTNEGRIELQHYDGLTLEGTITNDGTIGLNSSAGFGYLHVDDGGTATLTGAGALVVDGTTYVDNRSNSSDSGDAVTLINDTDHRIRGAQDGGTATLSMDNNVTLINRGLIQADSGDTVALSGGQPIDNTAGRIDAQDGSAVAIRDNTSISGGLFSTAGTGVISVTSGTYSNSARLTNVTNEGRIELQTIYDGLTLEGTITNDGTIGLNSSAGFGYLHIDDGGAATLTGTGALVVDGTTYVDNRSNSSDPGDAVTLINDTDHRIRGAQDGGTATLSMDNNVTLVNRGLIQADSGDTVALSGGQLIDNTAGRIDAQDGSALAIGNNTSISGGLLSTAGTGVISVTSGTYSNSARLTNVTNEGRIELQTIYDGLTLEGTITNDGTIGLNSSAGHGYLHVDDGATTTLTGSGALIVDNTTYLDSRSNSSDPADAVTLINDTNHLIRGAQEGGTATLSMDNIVTLANSGTIQADSSDTLNINGGTFSSTGTVQASDGSTVAFGSSVNQANNQSGVLTDGRWVAESTGNGATIELSGDAITENAAEIVLSGAGSVVGVRESASSFTALEDSLTNNQADGTLRVLDNRDYNNSNALTNAGVIELGGGTLDTQGLTNEADGLITGHGTVADRPLNSGTIEATGGTLTMQQGIQGGSGTVTIAPDGALDLSSATQASSADYLDHQGAATNSLNLGDQDFVVSVDYTNANSGTGNAYDARANVVGSGQIIGENADMMITGDVASTGTDTVTLDLGRVREGEVVTVNYQIANIGTGADIRGAIQTDANGATITDSRLSGSGVTAQNFDAIGAGADSGDFSVTFAATEGGSLDGQQIAVVSNFDNVAQQTITLTGVASSLAHGNLSPVSADLGHFRVGQDGLSQSFQVTNTTVGDHGEQLGIGSVSTSGNFSATNDLGSGLVDGGDIYANAATASISGGTAGVNNGSVTIQFTSDGSAIDSNFTAVDANAETVNLTATGFNMAQGGATPDPVVVANQRVGGSATQTLTVSNAAEAGDYTEGLNASFSGSTGDVHTNGGSIALLAGGASDSSAMTVGVDTSSAGARTGTVTLNYQTDGTGTSGLGTLDVGSQTVEVTGNVYQVAEGRLDTTAMDFGTVQVGQTVSEVLSISNVATGPDGYVEDLNASFGSSSGTGAGQISGSGSISGLVAGDTNNSDMTVSVDTSTAGSIDGSIGINYYSAGTVAGVSNGLGQLYVGSDAFGVQGLIEATANVIDAANPVIDTAQPILLGNVRQGASSPTALVSLTNQATGNDQAALNASISGNGAVTGSGSFDLLGPGDTDASSLQVGMDTSTAGAVNGNATIALVSDASNVGGCEPNCEMALASQTVTVEGAVYRLANPSVDPTEVVLAARVGDSGPSANIGVTNQSPDAYTEALDASIATSATGFSASGSVDNLAASASDNSSLTVGLDTATAGEFTGTASVSLTSTGEGTTGAADYDLGSTDVDLTGRVYTAASADVVDTLDFGTVHVGDSVTEMLSILNDAELTALNDTLAGNLTGTTGPFSGSGSFSGLSAQDSTSLGIGLDTSTAGVFNGSSSLLMSSQNPDMADLDLGTFGVDLFAQVNHYANPWFELLSGPGSLIASNTGGYSFTLDLGTLYSDQDSVELNLSFLNDVDGPADWLRGDFDLTGVDAFGLAGFDDSFSDLGWGGSIDDLMVSFNPFDYGLGLYEETISLTAFGYNDSGYEEQFDITLAMAVTVQDRATQAVDEPPVLVLMLIGLGALVGLRRRQMIA